MILCVHANAGFLNKSQSCSQAGAHIYLSENDPFPCAVLSIAQFIKNVMAFAAESKLAALFITAHKMIPHHQILIKMGWPQPKTPIHTNNSTATGVTNKKCPSMGQDDGYAPLVATMPWISRTMLLLLGCWIQEMGRLPHKTPPRHLQRISSDHSCRYIGLGQHMSPIHPQTMGPRVASLKAFPFFIFNFLHLSYFTTSWMLPQGCEDPLIPITDRSGCVKITATPTPLIM